MLKHILFDNDGTLVDSEILAVHVMLEMLGPHGIDLDQAEYERRFPGLQIRQILATLEREHGAVFSPDFLAQIRARHNEVFDEKLQPVAGMAALFRKIQVPKSVVSNGSALHVERCLRRVNLWADFDGEIFSAYDVGRPKPHPDVYLAALEKLKIRPSETLAVEDSEFGVASAKAAGLRVVGLLAAAHIGPGHEVDLKRGGADFIAHSAAALEGLLVDFQVVR